MIVAVMADVHANVAALSAALAAARTEKVEKLIVLGDIIGYYYNAQKVCDLIRAWPNICILGNHDRIFLQARYDPSLREGYRRKYGSGLEAALNQLDADSVAWLGSLEENVLVDLGSLRLQLCHGSPHDPDKYIYPNSVRSDLDACATPEVDGVLLAHTHYPFFRAGHPWLLNPGSIGQARDVGGFASWAKLNTETATIVFHRTAHDPSALIREVKRRDGRGAKHGSVLTRSNPMLEESASLLQGRLE